MNYALKDEFYLLYLLIYIRRGKPVSYSVRSIFKDVFAGHFYSDKARLRKKTCPSCRGKLGYVLLSNCHV